MSNSKGLSLRTKLIGLVMLVVCLLGAGAYIPMRQIVKSYEQDLFDTFETAAVSLAEKLSAQFFERYGDVQTFAANSHVQSLEPKSVQAALDRYIELYGIYDLIIVVDAQGRFVGANTKDAKGVAIHQKELSEITYKEAPWFKAAMKGEFTEDKEHGYEGAYYENPNLDPVLKLAFGQVRVGASFTTSIKDNSGKAIGVITTRSLAWIQNSFVDSYHILKKTDNVGAQLTLIDKEGTVLAQMVPSENSGKEILADDYDKIVFKKNLKEEHIPAGGKALQPGSGALYSQDKNDPGEDVVGYAFLENGNWNRSVKWSVLIQNTRAEVMEPAIAAQRNFYLIFGMVAFIAIAVAVFFGIAISKTIMSLTETLSRNSVDVSDASGKIAASSTSLSEAATEQAAALQETVAAVDEISAMVDKNAESANRSKEASVLSRDAAVRGRQIVEEMIQAINEISQSNDEVSNQMGASNRQLVEITQLINDIGTKTKVINEIVFQTKLLSFNASVEAARAGEYGKGFAVVAEEVGNLAQMSGNAAKEITTLLEESVRKVETIVSDSKVKVEKVMAQSKSKVQTGTQTANSCNEALEEILTSVSSVDTLVAEIAVASQEQATGIREISRAVGQMDQVTQQNSSVAEASSISAEQLNNQSHELRGIVGQLFTLVTGSYNQEQSPSSRHAPAVARSSASKTEKAKVVKLQGRKPASAKASAPFHASTPTHTPTLKKAAGDDFAPSADASGFEE